MTSPHSPNPNPKPTPKPGPLPGAPQVDPKKLRREVADILSQPAPTSQVRAEHFEAAHRLLHDALNASRSSSASGGGQNQNERDNHEHTDTGR